MKSIKLVSNPNNFVSHLKAPALVYILFLLHRCRNKCTPDLEINLRHQRVRTQYNTDDLQREFFSFFPVTIYQFNHSLRIDTIKIQFALVKESN